MGNYLRAEFYKVLRRKRLWVILGVLLGLEALLVLGWASIHINGKRVDFSSGVGTLAFMLDVGFYMTVITANLVFAGQYRNGTLKNEVSFGLPRGRMYLGKLLAQTGLSVLFCGAMLGVYLGLCALTQSRDPAEDAQVMERLGLWLAAAFPLWVGVQAMACALLFLVGNETGALFISLGVVAVLPGAVWLASMVSSGSSGSALGDGLMAVYRHMPTVVLSSAIDAPRDGTLLGRAWLVGAGWTAVFTALGLAGFRRREIR